MRTASKLTTYFLSLSCVIASVFSAGLFIKPQQAEAAWPVRMNCNVALPDAQLQQYCDKQAELVRKANAQPRQIDEATFLTEIAKNRQDYLKKYLEIEQAKPVGQKNEALINDIQATLTSNGDPTREVASPSSFPNECWSSITKAPHVETCLKEGMAWIGVFATQLAGWVLLLAVGIFDFSVTISILNFHQFVNNLPAINIAWGILRDFTNLSFIFILMYLAIGTILGFAAGKAKKTIPMIVVAALLVNFSIVLPKVVIDISNLVALQFYRATGPAIRDSSGNETSRRDVAGPLIKSINLPASLNTLPVDPDKPDMNRSFGVIFISSVGMFIMLLMTAVAFFAAALLLFIRTVVFLILIPLSPLVVAAWVVPIGAVKNYAGKWTSELFGQAFVAPTFMFMIYFAIKIVTSTTSDGKPALESIALGSLSESSKSFLTAVYFLFVIILVNIAITTAAKSKTIGSNYVASAAAKGKYWTTGLAERGLRGGSGMLGRRYVGRPAARLRDNKYLTKASAMWGVGSFARSIRGGLDATSSASFGGRKGGFSGTLKDAVATNKTFESRDNRLKHLANASSPARTAIFNSMSEGDKMALLKQNPKLYKKIVGGLSEEKQGDVRKAAEAGVKKATNDASSQLAIWDELDTDSRKAAYLALSDRDRASLEERIQTHKFENGKWVKDDDRVANLDLDDPTNRYAQDMKERMKWMSDDDQEKTKSKFKDRHYDLKGAEAAKKFNSLNLSDTAAVAEQLKILSDEKTSKHMGKVEGSRLLDDNVIGQLNRQHLKNANLSEEQNQKIFEHHEKEVKKFFKPGKNYKETNDDFKRLDADGQAKALRSRAIVRYLNARLDSAS